MFYLNQSPHVGKVVIHLGAVWEIAVRKKIYFSICEINVYGKNSLDHPFHEFSEARMRQSLIIKRHQEGGNKITHALK